LVSAPSVGIGFDALQFSGGVPEPRTATLILGAAAVGASTRVRSRRRPAS
jgi:hypothetical protein